MSPLVAQVDEPFIRWPWLADHTDLLRQKALEHLQLTGISLAIGFGISLVLASVIRRWRWTSGPIIGFTALVYAIPSVALLAALIPVFGLGIGAPVVALTSYSLAVLTPFFVEAFDGVPAATVDAARGLGYTSGQRFRKVVLPLAVPTIIGGLRIASVTIIGLVTVAGLFGLGGFGDLIEDGRIRAFSTPIMAGVVGSIGLAVMVDVLLVIAGRVVSPWKGRA